MRRVALLLVVLFSMSLVGAASIEPIVIYDVSDISTDNFQGEIVVLSGVGAYSWGTELGHLNANGFADKWKKVTGILGIRFNPVNEDGSYCKTYQPCSWEEQIAIIETEVGEYNVYLPAGDVYNTQLYFYVAQDGTTYWAKSEHTEGPNGYLDLSFEDAAVPEHIARISPNAVELDFDQAENCNNYYWFDDDTQKCSQTEFCGVFIYQGLRTFDTLDDCTVVLAEYLLNYDDMEDTEEENSLALVYIVLGLLVIVVLYFTINRMRKRLPKGVKRKSIVSKRRKVTKRKTKKKK
jgi:hypothetical protein